MLAWRLIATFNQSLSEAEHYFPAAINHTAATAIRSKAQATKYTVK